jgi:hypothetical protein
MTVLRAENLLKVSEPQFVTTINVSVFPGNKVMDAIYIKYQMDFDPRKLID